VCETEATLFMN